MVAVGGTRWAAVEQGRVQSADRWAASRMQRGSHSQKRHTVGMPSGCSSLGVMCVVQLPLLGLATVPAVVGDFFHSICKMRKYLLLSVCVCLSLEAFCCKHRPKQERTDRLR